MRSSKGVYQRYPRPGHRHESRSRPAELPAQKIIDPGIEDREQIVGVRLALAGGLSDFDDSR